MIDSPLIQIADSDARLEAARARSKAWREKYPERNKALVDGWHAANAERVREYQRQWHRKNAARLSAKGKAWRKVNAHRQRGYALRKLFGLTTEQYEAMLSAQNGACAICHQPETRKDRRTQKVKRLCVDHDHNTGKVRSLLCQVCNTTIGLMREDPVRLRAAADYIERHILHGTPEDRLPAA